MVTTAYLQRVQTVKCRPNLYDNPERRIVVIMHTFKMYGHSSEHLGESHGSSPVTTTPLLNHFLVTQFYFHVSI